MYELGEIADKSLDDGRKSAPKSPKRREKEKRGRKESRGRTLINKKRRKQKKGKRF